MASPTCFHPADRLCWRLVLGVLLARGVMETLAAAPPLAEIVEEAIQRYERQEKDFIGWEYDQLVIAEALDDDGNTAKRHEMDFLVTFDENGPNAELVAERGERLMPQFGEKDRQKVAEEIDANKEQMKLRRLLKFYTLSYLGEGEALGQPAYLIGFEPKPGVSIDNRFDKVLSQLKGRLWVAQKDYSILRSEARLMRPADLAWFLAKLGEMEFQYRGKKIPVGYGPAKLNLRFKLNLGPYEIHHRQFMTMKNYRKQSG